MALFDVRKLGPWRNKLRANVLPLPAEGTEAHRMVLMAGTFTGFATAAKVMARKFVSNILGTEFVAFGGAIQAWMLSLSIKAGIDIRTETPVKDFVRENGRVIGVIAEQNGREIRIGARDGVLVDAGGFARNEEMRSAYGPQPSSTRWTSANPGDTGEMIRAAQKLGGAIHGMDRAIWCISSILPDGRVGIHANELGKPHIILVDKNGQRFTDEAASYMATGQKIYENKAVPSWAIMDSRHRTRYPWAHIPPRFSPPNWVSSGYMKKVQTVAELAVQCGIDAAGLEATIARFNSFAETGKDLDFQRGERAYDRYFGDPTNHPNPNIGAISEAPFFAVEMYPGDVGTYGGLVTDEFGRVLDESGAVLQGLYATGNSTASVTGARYPGAGASIGASFIFGYRAARHACGAAED
jgi:3-oxosteroid 1-dehydrogenase